jgi:nucleoside-diphosphate-sugar epimerase
MPLASRFQPPEFPEPVQTMPSLRVTVNDKPTRVNVILSPEQKGIQSMNQNLVISGYGWLAGYVGNALSGKVNIIGTSRSPEKCFTLKAQGIEGVQYALGDDTSILCSHLPNATLLLNIPPGRRNTDLAVFTQNMLGLIDAAITASVAHIVFISTTSVYGDTTNDVLAEDSATQPQTASAKAHVTIENYLLSKRDQIDVSIVRLAGLVGPDRHPARSLSGRQLDAGNKRINLVHVSDVVSALTTIICDLPLNDVIHLCSLSHPKRGEYYVDAAHAMKIDAPHFSDTEAEPAGKVIDATQSWARLNITPEYSDPYRMF